MSIATLTPTEVRKLMVLAVVGKVLGRNIERAAAGWSLVLSLVYVVSDATLPAYVFMLQVMPLAMWGWITAVLAALRIGTLIVNGWWPVTLEVRIFLSIASLAIVWVPATVTFGLYANAYGLSAAGIPGLALAPYALTVELLCFLALRTRFEVERDCSDVGTSFGSVGGWYRQLAACLRQPRRETVE